MVEQGLRSQLFPDGALLSQATPLILATVALAVGIHFISRFVRFIVQRRKDNKLLKDFPGPPPHWLFGNLRQVSDLPSLQVCRVLVTM